MFMVFRVYIPHRDGSETAAISKYVSSMIAFLYEIYIGKMLLSLMNLDLKKKKHLRFENVEKGCLYGYYLYFGSGKMGRSPLKHQRWVISNFENAELMKKSSQLGHPKFNIVTLKRRNRLPVKMLCIYILRLNN